MSDTFSILLYVVWSVVIVTAIIIEFSIPTYYFGWAAAISASAALITHGVKQDAALEIIVFIAIWIPLWLIFFLLFKFVFKDKFHDNDDGFLKYIGKEYKVLKPNDADNYGIVLIDGKEFRYFSKTPHKKDEKIIIKKIKGVTAYID